MPGVLLVSFALQARSPCWPRSLPKRFPVVSGALSNQSTLIGHARPLWHFPARRTPAMPTNRMHPGTCRVQWNIPAHWRRHPLNMARETRAPQWVRAHLSSVPGLHQARAVRPLLLPDARPTVTGHPRKRSVPGRCAPVSRPSRSPAPSEWSRRGSRRSAAKCGG